MDVLTAARMFFRATGMDDRSDRKEDGYESPNLCNITYIGRGCRRGGAQDDKG